MKPGTGPKIVMALLGACFAQFGVATLWIWSIGDFTAGKTAAFAMGVIALPFFAFLYSRPLAKVLGVVVLLGFAMSMVWLAFQPTNPAPNPTIYQIAAIALCVLLAARVVLRRRAKRA
jgi:peptidoglycan/LPS O-acetylase OafA/YrhL